MKEKIQMFEERVTDLIELIKDLQAKDRDTQFVEKTLYTNLKVLSVMDPQSEVLRMFRKNHPHYPI